MTLNAILAEVDARYEVAATISTPTKVLFINEALGELSRDFGPVVEDVTTVTVEDQERYDYLDDMYDLSEIISLEVSNTTTPTSDSDYREYKLGYASGQKQYYSFYDAFRTSGGKRQFGLYPIPDTDDYVIRIRYRKPIPSLSLSAPTEEPDFDSRYHHILIAYCIAKCAASTSYPEPQIANHYIAEWQAGLDELYRHYGVQKAVNKPKRRDNRQWHVGRSYSRY